MKLRALLLGCGRIGSEFFTATKLGIYNHAAAYAACPETELAAVCDADLAKAVKAGDRWNVAARYSDPARALAETQPDIVSICTPDETHDELIRAALATPSVRAILAEKPLALEIAQAEELQRIAAERPVVLSVNYSRRFSLGHDDVRQRIQKGEFGRIVTATGFYTKGTLHNGTHWFDLARFLIGEVSSVHGFDLLGEAGADPTLDAHLRFANGATGRLQAFAATVGTIFEMDILGTAGRIRLAESTGQFETYRLAESRDFPGYRFFESGDALPIRNHDVLLHAVEDVVRCVKQGGQPQCTAEDGAAALRIAHAVRASARIGQPVVLQDHE